MLTLKRLAVLCSLLVLLLHHGQMALAFYTQGRAIDGNSFQTLEVVAPETLTARAEGHAVVLDWDAGENGDGYAVSGSANGRSSDCAGVEWSDVAEVTTTTWNDEAHWAPQGTYYCYRVKTTLAAWNSTHDNPKTAVRLGFLR